MLAFAVHQFACVQFQTAETFGAEPSRFDSYFFLLFTFRSQVIYRGGTGESQPVNFGECEYGLSVAGFRAKNRSLFPRASRFSIPAKNWPVVYRGLFLLLLK